MSNDSNRPMAPIYLNLFMPLEQENGKTVFVKLPVGVPIDITMASYSEKTVENMTDDQKLVLQILTETLKESGSDRCAFSLNFDCNLQKTGGEKKEALNAGAKIMFTREPVAS